MVTERRNWHGRLVERGPQGQWRRGDPCKTGSVERPGLPADARERSPRIRFATFLARRLVWLGTRSYRHLRALSIVAATAWAIASGADIATWIEVASCAVTLAESIKCRRTSCYNKRQTDRAAPD